MSEVKEVTFQVAMIEGVDVAVRCNVRPSVKNCSPRLLVKNGKAAIELPTFSWDLITVAHEGIHLAYWIVYEVLGDQDRKPYRGLLPSFDAAWRQGMSVIQEEAMCRLSDRWMTNFMLQAEAAGVEYRLMSNRKPWIGSYPAIPA